MTFITTVRNLSVFSFSAALVAGCGSSQPPRELIDARAAYARAQAGPAGELKPQTLDDARVSLGRAERAYGASADERDVRTLGYVAERKSELADIQGHDILNIAEQKQAAIEVQQLTQQQLGSTQKALQMERQEREEADRRAREALDRLATTMRGSEVRQEARGTVITLPGQVLFATGKSSLLSSARQKLNQVAEVLRDESDRHIVVEGHTDSKGTDQTNMVLSQQRADSVKDYLVSRGVPEGRIAASGLGSGKPVTSNASPEGRANNRRVEIIIEARPRE